MTSSSAITCISMPSHRTLGAVRTRSGSAYRVHIVHANVRYVLFVVHDTDSVRGGQAIDRALSILELFDEHVERLSIADIAARIGVHRSTASRMLATLARHRLVELDADSGTYALGLGLVSLGGHVLNRFAARANGREIVHELRDATQETAYLGVLDGDEVVYIEQASSPFVRVNADWVGRRQALSEGVSGAVLLAFMPVEVIRELLRGRATDSMLSSSESELASVREQGYLARYHQSASDHAVVAAPVRDYRGEVVAAVTLGGPRHRVSEQRFDEDLVPATRRAAARISEALGFASA